MIWWQRLIAWAAGALGAVGLGALVLRREKREALRAGELAGRAEERARQIEAARRAESELRTKDAAIDVDTEAATEAIDADTEAKLKLAEYLRAEERAKRSKP